VARCYSGGGDSGRVVLTDPDVRTAPLFETGATGYAWRGGTVNIGFVELSRSHIDYRIYTVH